MGVEGDEFFAPRHCMREPIEEIFRAAQLLDHAVEAHLAGDFPAAKQLVQAANLPKVRAWTESLWGSKAANPDQWKYHRFRKIASAPPLLPKELRVVKRTPPLADRRKIVDHYGRNCVFCGIPLIAEEIRRVFKAAYPDIQIWGLTNQTCHAAFQCMWMQFDHVLPHSRGGDNSVENIVVTCAPCNFGRMNWTLEEVGLINPRTRPVRRTDWDGLEQILLRQGRAPMGVDKIVLSLTGSVAELVQRQSRRTRPSPNRC